MSRLIRIPDVLVYGNAIALLLAVGAPSLAMPLRTLIRRAGEVSYIATYALLLAVTAGAGALVAGMPLLPRSAAGGAIGISLGVLGGLAAAYVDIAISRRAFRRQLVQQRTRRAAFGDARPMNTAPAPDAGIAGAPMTWLVSAGMLEETAYRGVLWQMSLRLSALPLRVAALIAITIAFALSHLQFGWRHVVAKLPLSIVAGALTLATGSVAAAMFAHGAFNARMGRELGGRA